MSNSPSPQAEFWTSLTQLGVDHYTGLFEMVEQSAGRGAAVKIFLLLGQKGAYLIKYQQKSGAIEQQKIADRASGDSVHLEHLQREARLQALWADVVGSCAPLAFDIILIGVGVATSSVGGWTLIVWKTAELGVGAVKCHLATDAYRAAKNGVAAIVDSLEGKSLSRGLDVADLGFTLTSFYKSGSKLAQAGGLLQREGLHFGRHLAEQVAWREGAKIALVHLPSFYLKSANLLSSPRTLTAHDVEQELQRAAAAPPSLPAFDAWPPDCLLHGCFPTLRELQTLWGLLPQ